MFGIRAVGWATAGAALFADTLTKILGRHALPAEGYVLFPGIILRVFDNTRGPFGLGPLWLTIVASVAILIIMFRGRWRAMPQAPFPLALVVGGGFSNLVERLLFGRTTDLLVLGNVTALNVADAAILGGLVLLLWPRPLHRHTVVA